MLSIVHSTVNEPDEYQHLFEASNKDLELIIIDSKWSEERRQKIKDIPHAFKRVTYAPPKFRNEKMFCDFISAHNTGLAYAEEPLIVAMGGQNEFCPNFFEKVAENIHHFGFHVAFRPLELEASQGDEKWKTYVVHPHRYSIMPCEPFGRDGLRSVLPIQTCGFIIMSRVNWYRLNGFDERYDIGGHWYDNDLLTRLYNAKINVVFDQQLMIYRHPHKSAFASPRTEACKKLYEETIHEVYAPNSFDLRKLNESLLNKKKEYMV